MNSPHLLPLGFLLLALAAFCPNIATSTVEETEDSSFDNTNVAVFLCKESKSCTCNPRKINFANFTKIAEAQTKMLPDVRIEMVTNETHITVCFEPANSCLEGIYGVFWQKGGGSGLSCGILNSGENGTENITTKEMSICCEAETDIWKHNPTLKCYTKKSCLKSATLLADIPDDLPSIKSSTVIWFAVLFAVICAGCAAVYFLWLRRCRAFRQSRHFSEKEILREVLKPSTREKTSLPVASSSLSRYTGTSCAQTDFP